MDTTTNNVSHSVASSLAPLSQNTATRYTRFIDGICIAGLMLVALLVRIILATQLDMMTDEGIYITGGKIYFPLLLNGEIGAPGWSYNYEHPPLVKLLIGLALSINSLFPSPLPELLAARMPTIVLGACMVTAVYVLGRAPFGRLVALLAALSLAVSPWLSFFTTLAYLDGTMVALITVAYLLLWHAIRRPWLYLLVAVLVGFGSASKYPAVLMVPPMLLFTAYYFFMLRRAMPANQRPSLPWRWWIGAIALCPLAFLVANPVIWPDPIGLLLKSFDFQWKHSVNGHLMFLAGEPRFHAPRWAILYIVAAKVSALVTLPAIFFFVLTLVQLVRFHLGRSRHTVSEIAPRAFLWLWLAGGLLMYSQLSIVVGTHYHLPVAPAVVLAGTWGLILLLRFAYTGLGNARKRFLREQTRRTERSQQDNEPANAINDGPYAFGNTQAGKLSRGIEVVLLALAIVVPHLTGLLTVPYAEGYSSVFFRNENTSVQVAYIGYRDALNWLSEHTDERARVGLVAQPQTLLMGSENPSWYHYNRHFTNHFELIEVSPNTIDFPYDYLIWPMHLEQRGFHYPITWDVKHTLSGGGTIYCYILAAPTTMTKG